MIDVVATATTMGSAPGILLGIVFASPERFVRLRASQRCRRSESAALADSVDGETDASRGMHGVAVGRQCQNDQVVMADKGVVGSWLKAGECVRVLTRRTALSIRTIFPGVLLCLVRRNVFDRGNHDPTEGKAARRSTLSANNEVRRVVIDHFGVQSTSGASRT